MKLAMIECTAAVVALLLVGCGDPGSASEADTDADDDDDDDDETGSEQTGDDTSTPGTTTVDPSDGEESGESGGPAPQCEGDDAVTCYGGALGTLNVGVCAAGVQTCEGGMWSACLGEVLPGDELCNGDDDDCDAEIDEGCECSPAQTQPCYAGPRGTEGVGACTAGLETCDDAGMWGACEGAVVPVDEGCNGSDDDCDGDIDEVCDCTPGDTQACYSGPSDTQGVGECTAGIQTCTNAGTWGACDGDVTPVAESCDGDDDDCNGETDDLAAVEACETGADGECNAGEQACEDGELVCEQVVMPVAETCDTLDNDCDGTADEGLEDDPILLAGELPDTWSTTIPLVGSYPAASAGTVPGRLHAASDEDWVSVFAEEQVIDILGDTPVVGTVTIESPGPGFAYEACACWSTSTAFCGKTQGGASQVCTTSNGGGTAQLQVQMAMIFGQDDTGYLDIVVRPDGGSEVGCDLYEVGWFVAEP